MGVEEEPAIAFDRLILESAELMTRVVRLLLKLKLLSQALQSVSEELAGLKDGPGAIHPAGDVTQVQVPPARQPRAAERPGPLSSTLTKLF
jgi:hypothetical protein